MEWRLSEHSNAILSNHVLPSHKLEQSGLACSVNSNHFTFPACSGCLLPWLPSSMQLDITKQVQCSNSRISVIAFLFTCTVGTDQQAPAALWQVQIAVVDERGATGVREF